MGFFSKKIKLFIFRYKYRLLNPHNHTYPVTVFDIRKVTVGNNTYGPINIKTFGNDNEKLVIGSYCSIAENTVFLLGGEHDYKKISTYPFEKKLFHNGVDAITKGHIIIEDDVWIGYGAMILSGVKIGQGSVIAAGAVVTKDVEPYSIVAGVPAQRIKYRFDKEIIEKLLKIDFSKLAYEDILNNRALLKKHIDSTNYLMIVDQILKK